MVMRFVLTALAAALLSTDSAIAQVGGSPPKRGSTERSVEVLQTATIINRSVSGGQTDQMGQSS
jgi:hypothetical protein